MNQDRVGQAPSVGAGTSIGFLISDSLLPSVPDGAPSPSIWSDGTATAVFIASCIAAVFGIYKTFTESIKHNGLLLGSIVGFFKALTALLAAICTIGALQKLFEKRASIRQMIISVVVLGSLAWLMRKLINGEAVYSNRRLAVQGD